VSILLLMHPHPKLLGAVPAASLMLLTICGGPSVAGAYEDALAAWSRGEYANAYWLWRPLAEQGNADAQFYLGLMKENGQGVPRDDGEALKWYRKAADQDLALAQFDLGTMYANGRGVPQNDREAAKWYRLAADQGLGAAQFNLGVMYVEGKGVPRDYVQAHMWLTLLVSKLPALGKNQRNTIIDTRDFVASKMDPAQIAESHQLAFGWMIERRNRARQKEFATTFLNSQSASGPLDTLSASSERATRTQRPK
jgi:hypothetical protein